jgi:hypothetical protein
VSPNFVAMNISSRFPVRFSLQDPLSDHPGRRMMELNTPFSDEVFRVLIEVGRIPERAALRVCRVENLLVTVKSRRVSCESGRTFSRSSSLATVP